MFPLRRDYKCSLVGMKCNFLGDQPANLKCIALTVQIPPLGLRADEKCREVEVLIYIMYILFEYYQAGEGHLSERDGQI